MMKLIACCILFVFSITGVALDGSSTGPAQTPEGKRYPRDCTDIFSKGGTCSWVYLIYPQGSEELDAFCDQNTDGGGWTIIQKRFDGVENFYRDWNDYKYGFGNKTGEYWLGNQIIYEIVQQGVYELRIDLTDFDNETRYALYKKFYIDDETNGYRLHLEGYEGTAGDSLMSRHGGHQFHTKDRDDGSRCAQRYTGAWWYNACHESNLNGLYLNGSHRSYADGSEWYAWHGYHFSLKSTEMKIRRL
uniref:Techylectin-5A-like n=1 Tax=Crassostrea virginica TaxID=6565 RepID=A0A8B8BFG1_CRAVI|nr:techylectin-5A-like [Crassostrea virginica]